MMEEPSHFTELPVPLISTAALLRIQQSQASNTISRFHPYLQNHRFHQMHHHHHHHHQINNSSNCYQQNPTPNNSSINQPVHQQDFKSSATHQPGSFSNNDLLGSTEVDDSYGDELDPCYHQHQTKLWDEEDQQVMRKQTAAAAAASRTSHISCLYPEILAIIFSYLDVRDRGRAAQVCTTWRDAAYHKSVWRGVEAKLHMRRSYTTLFPSLVKRGIKKVQVLSIRRTLKEVVHGIPNMESLNLSGCYTISDNNLSQAFVADMPKLTALNLSLCKQITDNALSRIAQYLKNLEVLELGGCCNITNTGLALIAWTLKKLKRLNLRSCWHISDQGVSQLAAGNQCLEYLSLQDCQRITDDGLRYAQGLSSLKKINLSFCISITDHGLRYVAKMSNLRELNLRSCDNISDNGIFFLTEGGSRVTHLDVSFCDKIGDQALVHVSQGLYHLQSLSLSASHISDEGLGKIASTLHDLETLNIGQCNRVTDKGLITVSEHMQRLKCIDLYGCTRITTQGLEKIMKLPQLSVLNLGLWHVR